MYCATDIKKMLAMKHRGDLFFTEVKNGPTQIVSHHARIDALAMPISWTNFQITGYEVKVARSDFLRDNKWQAYLPMCNQLYFAVAPGVCDVSEVPETCGLMQVTSSGALRTVKKAPWREIEMPVDMLMYLLFTYVRPRSGLPRADDLARDARVEIFKKYLDDKAQWHELGYRVSKKIRKEHDELRRDNLRLKNAFDDARRTEQEIDAICKALGVTNGYRRADECIKAIEAMKGLGGITPSTQRAIFKIKADAEILLKELESYGKEISDV
ncbi:MAG: MmcB family DNA repair protein [Clostridia bacterium]|nr:MmcB family DNA repair protein [Clostridia bacterium]